MLLNNTSGIGDIGDNPAQFERMLLADTTRRYSPTKVLHLDATVPARARPGDTFSYSCANFAALAYIVERITGRTFAQVFTNQISRPLGLRDTTFDAGGTNPTLHGWFSLQPIGDVENGTFDPKQPRGSDARTFPHQAVQTLVYGGANVISSLRDLLTWATVLYGGNVLNARVKSDMLRMTEHYTEYVVGSYYPTAIRYGLGTMGWCPCNPPTDASVVGHTGKAVGGGRSIMAYDRRTDVAIAAFANVSEISWHDLTTLLAQVDALTGQHIQTAPTRN